MAGRVARRRCPLTACNRASSRTRASAADAQGRRRLLRREHLLARRRVRRAAAVHGQWRRGSRLRLARVLWPGALRDPDARPHQHCRVALHEEQRGYPRIVRGAPQPTKKNPPPSLTHLPLTCAPVIPACVHRATSSRPSPGRPTPTATSCATSPPRGSRRRPGSHSRG